MSSGDLGSTLEPWAESSYSPGRKWHRYGFNPSKTGQLPVMRLQVELMDAGHYHWSMYGYSGPIEARLGRGDADSLELAKQLAEQALSIRCPPLSDWDETRVPTGTRVIVSWVRRDHQGRTRCMVTKDSQGGWRWESSASNGATQMQGSHQDFEQAKKEASWLFERPVATQGTETEAKEILMMGMSRLTKALED